MLKIPGMLLLGSTCRKVGKTDLAVKIIQHFSHARIVAVKVTPIHPTRPCPSGRASCGACESLSGPLEIEEEKSTIGDKDTQRMLAAGAHRSFWLRAKGQYLQQALEQLVAGIEPGLPLLVESCSVRQIAEPDLFIMVGKGAPCAWKSSAKKVRKYADRFVTAADNDKLDSVSKAGGFDLEELQLHRGRWSLPTDASAIILAGGKSSRMGRDKSMIDVGGRPLISVLVQQLTGWFDEVLVSSNDPDKFSFLGLRVVRDLQPGQGPLMGMACALQESNSERNLVLACDIPVVDKALIRRLLAGLEHADVVIPVDERGRLEPLYAAYSKTVSSVMFETLAAGGRRIVDAFDGLDIQKITLEKHERLPNLNTPEDFGEWKAHGYVVNDRF